MQPISSELKPFTQRAAAPPHPVGRGYRSHGGKVASYCCVAMVSLPIQR
jgi:hypothetical protein